MNIQLRTLTIHDAEKYQALRLYSFREAPYAFSESYEDELQRSVAEIEREIAPQPEQFVLGAFAQDELVGCVSFIRDCRTKARHKAFVRAMYVHREHRKLGVGKMLIEEVIAAARQMDGLEHIHLWVLHDGESSASGFYRGVGFISQGPVVRNDLKIGDRYVDAEYMVLYLR